MTPGVRPEEMMKTAITIAALAALVVSCSPRKAMPPPFPPRDGVALQRFAEHYVPYIEIIPSGTTVRAARVPRSGAYEGLSTFFFAYPCSRYGAERLLRTDSTLDNSIKIKTPPLVVAKDADEVGRQLTIRPPDMSRSTTFPDVFYEKLDLSGCTNLFIRMNGAPTWYTPDTITNGLADRCMWGLGRVMTEFYFDEDKGLMYMRFDELRAD